MGESVGRTGRTADIDTLSVTLETGEGAADSLREPDSLSLVLGGSVTDPVGLVL